CRARRERPRRGRAAEKRDELAPLHVEHGGPPPLRAIGAADGPVRSVFHTSNLPQSGRQVLGEVLNRSESSKGRLRPLLGFRPKHTPVWPETAVLPDFDPACARIRVRLGPGAMSARCPVCPKADTAGRFYEYTPLVPLPLTRLAP